MWTCPKCGRMFQKAKQPHSCHTIPLGQHFTNKEKAEGLFDSLVKKINANIGTCMTISLPCCIHLFGKYDFLAALPKKDGLEVRIALNRKADSPKLEQSVPLSQKRYKNCFMIRSEKEMNAEFVGWLKEAYNLND